MSAGGARDGLAVPLAGLVEGTIISRPNRFVAVVRLPHGDVNAHVADSGRLKELVFPGNRALVREAAKGDAGAHRPYRMTAHDLVLTAWSGSPAGADGSPTGTPPAPLWVAVDTRYPNRLFGHAVSAGALREFAQYTSVQPEYWYHLLPPWREELEGGQPEPGGRRQGKVRSRMDFFLTAGKAVRNGADEPGSHSEVYSVGDASEDLVGYPESGAGSLAGTGAGVPPGIVEVKSVTLCRDGVGLFPDAPTERGRRHLRELMRAAEYGYRAFGVFIAQRSDVEVISPNRETDPDFADTMKEAQDRGVTFLGYRCSVTPAEIRLDPVPIPVVV